MPQIMLFSFWLYRASVGAPWHVEQSATNLFRSRRARGDDVSSVVDVILSASQDMAFQTIVSRPHHLICSSQTV